MRIHFNWQIIRRPIKDAKSGGGARDSTSERIQLCKRSRERRAELPGTVTDRSLSSNMHSLTLFFTVNILLKHLKLRVRLSHLSLALMQEIILPISIIYFHNTTNFKKISSTRML